MSLSHEFGEFTNFTNLDVDNPIVSTSKLVKFVNSSNSWLLF